MKNVCMNGLFCLFFVFSFVSSAFGGKKTCKHVRLKMEAPKHTAWVKASIISYADPTKGKNGGKRKKQRPFAKKNHHKGKGQILTLDFPHIKNQKTKIRVLFRRPFTKSTFYGHARDKHGNQEFVCKDGMTLYVPVHY